MKTNSKHIGIVSEHKVITELLVLGYDVSVPIGDNCSYDILLDYNGKILKCQIKTMIFKDGCITLPLDRCRINTKKQIRKPYSKKDVDFFLGYCRTNNTCYFYPFKNNPNTCSVSFRASPTKNMQELKTRNAVSYEIKNLSAYLETGKV